MASTNWTELTDGLDSATVDRGVTNGISRPPSNISNNFLYGFNSLVVATGAVGFFTNQVNFAPMAKGMSIRGAIKRGVSGGNENFAPMFMVGLQGTSVNDNAYLFGLGDGDPYHLILKKGAPSAGLADLVPDPPNNGILLRSTGSYSNDTWHHIRVDMIVNDNGDVTLQCFENDLAAQLIGDAPSWVAIPGMEEFIDDALQVNSGSAALTSGRAGFAFYTADVTRRGYFDHMEIFRQV